MKFNKIIDLAALGFLFVSFGSIKAAADKSRGYKTWRDDKPAFTSLAHPFKFKEAYVQFKVSKEAREKYPGRYYKFTLIGDGIENLPAKDNTYVLPRTVSLDGKPRKPGDEEYSIYRELHEADFAPESDKCFHTVRVTVYKTKADLDADIQADGRVISIKSPGKPEDVPIFRSKTKDTVGTFEHSGVVCRGRNGRWGSREYLMSDSERLFIGKEYTVKLGKTGGLYLGRATDVR